MPTCLPPVPMVPCPLTHGLGLPCPGLVAHPAPEMEALTPSPLFLELLAKWAQCPASSPAAGSLPAARHLLGLPTWAMSWGAPTGALMPPRPDKGAASEPVAPWGAVGKAWGGHTPPLFIAKGNYL